MDFIYVTALILVLFNAKKGAECDDEDVIAMPGCNISLTWTLPNTRKDLLAFHIGSSHRREIATLAAGGNCDVQDNPSMFCNINGIGDELIVVLTMFNVTAGQSDSYTLWRQTVLPGQYSNTSKKLAVIGKPKIMEVRKPILGLPFQMICNTTHEQEGYLYRWRINGRERTTVHSLNSQNISSLGMIDNFSNVTCQVCFNEKASNLSSVTCENDSCSIDSDPYTIQVLYGPDNVSLSRGERDFYLKEHDIFAIDCFANCYPNCIFWWKGRDTIESQKLNIIFESRMSGQYACHVINQQTNITLISDPITLHHANEDDKRHEDNMVLSMGLVGVAVLLVVIGYLLVRRRRKNRSDKIDSIVLNELVVKLQTFTNREMSQGISRIQNRPFPVQNKHEATSRRRYSPEYPNHKRQSRSLNNLLDSTQDSFYPLRGGLSLHALYSPSNIKDRSLRDGTRGNGPIKRRDFSNEEENQLDNMNRLENGNKLEFLYAKSRKDRETKRDEQSAGAKSETLNNLQRVTFEEEPQENPYNTIDENQLDDMSRLEKGNKLEFLHAKVRKDKETYINKHSAEAKSETLNHLQQEEEPHENTYNTIKMFCPSTMAKETIAQTEIQISANK